MDAGDRRIVLVTRSTRLEELIARHNTVAQARFQIEHLGADFSDYEREHASYLTALTEVEAVLARLAKVQRLDRRYLPSFLFAPDALVVVLGQDGLVANTLKYLDGQPVLGVNPEPARWDGVLLPFQPADLARIMPEALRRQRATRTVTMARAQLADGQVLDAVNDLFIGPRSHQSARYHLAVGGREEAQSSSGIIVSTGLGSTGWFRSLVCGALAMQGASASTDLATLRDHGFAWDASHLRYTVREPFPSRTSAATLVFGEIDADVPMAVTSQMPGHGVIFSDGIEQDFLEFNAGMRAEIGVSPRHGCLVV